MNKSWQIEEKKENRYMGAGGGGTERARNMTLNGHGFVERAER